MDLTLTNLVEELSPQSSAAEAASQSANKSAEVQATSPAAVWQSLQDKFAEAAGLAVLLVDGQQPPSLAVSNNNSVCRVLQSSEAHAQLCQPYCGAAFEKAQAAVGKAWSYRCHAGLQCVAVGLEPNVIRPLVAIVGRAFTRVAEYQSVLDRIHGGEWQDVPAAEACQNLLFAESEAEVAEVAEALQEMDTDKRQALLEFVARTEANPFSEIAVSSNQAVMRENPAEVVAPAATATVASEDALKAANENAVEVAQENVAQEAKVAASVAPEERTEAAHEERTEIADKNVTESVAAPAAAHDEVIELKSDNQFSLIVLKQENLNKSEQNEKSKNIVAARESDGNEDFAAWQFFTSELLDKSLKEACVETLRFLAVRYDFAALGWLERSADNLLEPYLVAENFAANFSQFEFVANDPRFQNAISAETSYRANNFGDVELFPLVVGEDVRAVIVIGDSIEDDEQRRRIARFCQQIAVSFEVLRLREELARRAEVVRSVQLFNEKLNETSHTSLFDSLIETCAEFLDATRGSLLIYNETKRKLEVVAAIGQHAEELKQNLTSIGERVAERVFRKGKPILIENVFNLSLPPAPTERAYRSSSFICFPLVIGTRTVDVLNLTDKRSGENYNQKDLKFLEAIAPQLAIALDRATYQQRAGMFEQLSITDSLTGLLNRRYLSERLSEEVNRAKRDGLPMSFMMIDIDNFKAYNDAFGHQAGDEVLKLTAQCLKSALRNVDVAARYGGEEFSLLLPQTTLIEARMIGERIRERIEKTVFPHREITVSIGIAAYSPYHDSINEIIEAADKALYLAKGSGKNKVQVLLSNQTGDSISG